VTPPPNIIKNLLLRRACSPVGLIDCTSYKYCYVPLSTHGMFANVGSNKAIEWIWIIARSSCGIDRFSPLFESVTNRQCNVCTRLMRARRCSTWIWWFKWLHPLSISLRQTSIFPEICVLYYIYIIHYNMVKRTKYSWTSCKRPPWMSSFVVAHERRSLTTVSNYIVISLGT